MIVCVSQEACFCRGPGVRRGYGVTVDDLQGIEIRSRGK